MQNMNNGKSTFGLDANVVSMLCYIGNFCCYLGAILAIITIVQDKTNKLARFHAFQSLLLAAVGIVLGIGINIISGLGMAANSTALSGLAMIVALVFGIAMLGAVIFSAIKAFGGEIFKLPVIGDMADKWSN